MRSTNKRPAIRRPSSLFLAAYALACSSMIASCAPSAPPSALTGLPPQIAVPADADTPCELAVSAYLTIEDLELALRQRGDALVDCDGRRALAVDALRREHGLQAQWLAQREARARSAWFRVFTRR